MQRTVPDMLAAVSRELTALVDLTTSLQLQLSPHAASMLDIEAVQHLDLLTQTLACLAPFVAELGTALPPADPIDLDHALNGIRLSALSRRLRGLAPAPVETTASWCELF